MRTGRHAMHGEWSEPCFGYPLGKYTHFDCSCVSKTWNSCKKSVDYPWGFMVVSVSWGARVICLYPFVFAAEKGKCTWTTKRALSVRRMVYWQEVGRRCSQRECGPWGCQPHLQWGLWSFCAWPGGWVSRWDLQLLGDVQQFLLYPFRPHPRIQNVHP